MEHLLTREIFLPFATFVALMAKRALAGHYS